MQGRIVRNSSPRRHAKEKRDRLTLLDLPDELLLQVIDHLDAAGMFTLTMLCKRLHELALSAYFVRYGLTMPLDSTNALMLKGKQLNALPGLQMASFTKDIKHLHCKFNYLEHDRNLAVITHRICWLILKIERLESLTFDFDGCDLGHLSARWGLVVCARIAACSDLLTTAARRCTSLELSHAGASSERHHQLEKEATKWLNRDRSLARNGPFNALRRYLLPGNSFSRSSHAQQTSSTLKTLVLHSNMFLLPPFSDWAFHTLNTAPLTKLELIGVVLSQIAAALIFQCINIPTLEHLCITTCRFPLDEFLPRLNTVSTLRIVADTIFSLSPYLPKSALPRLLALHSNPNTVVHLLTPTGAFPQLAEVRILVYLSLDDQFIFHTVENKLSPVAHRLTGANVRICLDVFPSSRTDNWVDLEDVDDLANFPVLRRVRTIAFGMPRPDIAATSAIPTWLSMFPLLEGLEFVNSPNDLSHEAKMSLLRHIVQECPGINSVKIDEETRSVADWLSSESLGVLASVSNTQEPILPSFSRGSWRRPSLLNGDGRDQEAAACRHSINNITLVCDHEYRLRIPLHSCDSSCLALIN